jgi:hypothetical protein
MIGEVPIKKRIVMIRLSKASIKESIELSRGLNAESKKNLIIIEKEMKILESILQDPFVVVKDYFEMAKDTLKSQFEKECALYDEQTGFLQEQIHQMIDDKLKAHQNCLMLEEKIRHLTEDIG